MVTLNTALKAWENEERQYVIDTYGVDDTPALRESWSNYTDMLCKDGELTDLQYQHCPCYDEQIPDDSDEPAFLLTAMKVTMDAQSIVKRPDGLMDDMHEGATHWKITLARGTKFWVTYYSMGPAHTDSPDMADVFHSLLMDTSDVDGSFEDWAENMGYDSDSRKAERIYHACRVSAKKRAEMFTQSEIDDLRTAFEDY